MKNILFVSDSFLGGGLETRIIEQIKTLKKNRIKPFLLCHQLNPLYSKHFIASSDALLMHTPNNNISAEIVLKDVDTICNFCIKNDIDFIDCNPFWCLLPTVLASQKLNIPCSFTLHGVTSGNFIAKEFLSAQILYNLALSYGFDQIFAVAEYLLNLYPQLTNTSIIRNGFNINDLRQKKFKNTQKAAIASRLDEPKSQIIIDFLPKLYKCNAIKQIDIFGNGDCPIVKNFIIDNHLEDKVHIQGWTENLSESVYKGDYMIIFGMGRVILDAIKSGIPAGVLGYGGFAGLVSRSRLIEFSKNNLTSWQESNTTLTYELNQLFKKPSNYLFKSDDLSIFNNNIIWENYYSIIKETKVTNQPFLNNIYNLLLADPSINILNNDSLFLECVRMFSDGNKPISPDLFYSIFQEQFDKIHKLQKNVKELQNNVNQKLSKRIIRKINSYSHKKTNNI